MCIEMVLLEFIHRLRSLHCPIYISAPAKLGPVPYGSGSDQIGTGVSAPAPVPVPAKWGRDRLYLDFSKYDRNSNQTIIMYRVVSFIANA
jgi:hypothetical protein